MISLELIQSAAKLIEADGTEGFRSAVKKVGWEMATAMLVSYLRFQSKSTATFPADPAIDANVNRVLTGVLPSKYMEVMQKGGDLFYMGRAYALDNFSAFTVLYRSITWPTAEHAWQADKFFKYADPSVFVDVEPREAVIQRILHAPSAHDAKKIAHEHGMERAMRKRDDEEKKSTMGTIIRLKFDQHEQVQKTLRRTTGFIVEDSPTDSFWGRGQDWDGKDALGSLWTELRYEKFGY